MIHKVSYSSIWSVFLQAHNSNKAICMIWISRSYRSTGRLLIMTKQSPCMTMSMFYAIWYIRFMYRSHRFYLKETTHTKITCRHQWHLQEATLSCKLIILIWDLGNFTQYNNRRSYVMCNEVRLDKYVWLGVDLSYKTSNYRGSVLNNRIAQISEDDTHATIMICVPTWFSVGFS